MYYVMNNSLNNNNSGLQNNCHSKPRLKGVVKWHRNLRVKTSCEMEIKNFPYDIQSCPITLSSQDNSNEFLLLSTRKWNRVNNVNEDSNKVEPKDITTIKVRILQ